MALKSVTLSAANPNKIVAASLTGTVSVQMEEFVARVISHAEKESAGLVVFRLDTPGGLVEATRGITQTILNSNVPVVMWVPPGGRAASAGAFMMQAAHVSAMASGTNIGAASPVVASGKDVPGDMKKKVVNDLMAQMRSLTQMRGRNEEVAQRMIEESLSLTAHEALEENAIDVVADDMNSLLHAANGRRIELNGQHAVIDVSPNAGVETVEMNFQEQFIQFLSSPDIAYLLLAGGLMALFYEIITPSGFILGVIGAVMLLLGGIGLKMLPFNWAGVALVGAGAVIMGIEVMTGGTGGLLALLGTAVMIAGGIFLFRAPGGELLSVSMSLMAGMAIALGLCFTIFAMMITKTLRSKVTTGREGLIGLDVEITEDLDPEGMVKCHGEVWKARTAGESLRRGNRAVVTSTEGIILIVKAK
jgi:membrane-bound serine protease (ClpP class)